MPIDYSKYPPNWKSEIRPRILKRANDCCEKCGFKNKQIVYSFVESGKIVWKNIETLNEFINLGEPKMVKVVLTIAHLDHDEHNHNVKDERLMAMCQLCHLRYDAKEKQKRKQLNKSN